MIIAFYPGAGGNRYLRMTENREWQKLHCDYDDLVCNQSPDHRYLYTDSEIHSNSEVILTHCLTTSLIRKICPDRSITVIIGNMQSCLRREWSLNGHDRYQQKIKADVLDELELELYHAVKDSSWPDIRSVNDLKDLPTCVHAEFMDFKKAQMKKLTETNDPLAQLQKHCHDMIESAYATIQWHLNYYQTYPLDLSQCDNVVDLDGHSKFSEIMSQELACYPSEIFDRCWQILS